MRYSTLREMTPKGERDCLALSNLTRKGLGRSTHFYQEYQLLSITRLGKLALFVNGEPVSISGPVILLMGPGCNCRWEWEGADPGLMTGESRSMAGVAEPMTSVSGPMVVKPGHISGEHGSMGGEIGSKERVSESMTAGAGSISGQPGSMTGESGSMAGVAESMTSVSGPMVVKPGHISGEHGSMGGESGSIERVSGSVTAGSGSIAGQPGSMTGESGSVTGESGSMAGESGLIAGVSESMERMAESKERVSGSMTEGVILRFPADLLSDGLLEKNPMKGIGDLLERAKSGLVFDVDGIMTKADNMSAIQEAIGGLGNRRGFETYMGLLSILHSLSVTDPRSLGAERKEEDGSGELLIESAVLYMRENYDKPITLEDVAGKARMSRGAFCRFILKRTGKTYLESLNEIRLENVCGMLTGSTDNIAEIAFKAGYNHVTYFNRWFKRQKGCTPKEFRERETPAALRPAS